MGLDMYLYCNSKQLTDKMHEGEPYGDYITPLYKKRGVVVYWRKANAVHDWFVKEVQGGNDDCRTYEVDLEQLLELKSACERIVNECHLVKGMVKRGSRYVGDRWEDIIDEGEVLDNPELAEEILPTRGGFFFGGTDYDQWYYEEVKDTARELGRILGMLEIQKGDFGWEYPTMPGEPDWEVKFYYHSSW